MKRYIALLILGILIGACHDVGTGGPSLGAPDLGGSDDQSINDLAVMNLTSPWSTLSLVAGGLGGAGNGDGTGADARFLFPYGVAANGAGNVFVASPLHHTEKWWWPQGRSPPWPASRACPAAPMALAQMLAYSTPLDWPQTARATSSSRIPATTRSERW